MISRLAKGFAGLLAAASLALISGLSYAHSDVELGLEGGNITVDPEGESPSNFFSGYTVFRADFGDAAGGPWSTDDPGFNNDHAITEGEPGFAVGSYIGFDIVGTLSYWDGATWSNTTPGSETLTVSDFLAADTVIDTASVTDGSTMFIGQVSGPAGAIHEHIDFTINTGAAAGAYSIVMQLFSWTSAVDPTPIHGPSNPFQLVFNRGLSGADFDAALAAIVPLPAGVWLLISGIVGLVAFGRRRRDAIVAA